MADVKACRYHAEPAHCCWDCYEFQRATITDLRAALAAAEARGMERAAQIAEARANETEAMFEQLRAVASDPNDMGVLKFVCYAGEASRLAGAIRAAAGGKP